MAEELKKGVLGFPSLLATAAGVFVASTTLVSLGQGVGVGGYTFVLAMIVACFLMVIQAITFSELSLMMPRAGSVSSYTEIALGHFPAIVATLSGYIIIQLLAGPAELSVAGIILHQVFLPRDFPQGHFSCFAGNHHDIEPSWGRCFRELPDPIHHDRRSYALRYRCSRSRQHSPNPPTTHALDAR